AGGRRPWWARLRATFDRLFAWEGTVDGLRKAALLSEANALLFPIRWPEPFGLVMVESLMSGTPVLATPMGSVPEIISPETGIQIALSDADRWSWALKEGWKALKRDRCREWAMERYHYRKMAENYGRIYGKILNGERINLKTPVATDWNLAGPAIQARE
ncbi:MAG: glycosyltransferase, partial [Bdellovibrionota bacterium]